jgi:hypothetical protein
MSMSMGNTRNKPCTSRKRIGEYMDKEPPDKGQGLFPRQLKRKMGLTAYANLCISKACSLSSSSV